jgi:hypothetical protein
LKRFPIPLFDGVELWEDVTSFIRRGWLLHILDVIDKQDPLLKKMRLDRDSAHPNYKFEKGFFQIRIDEHKKTARLSNYELPKLCELPNVAILVGGFAVTG